MLTFNSNNLQASLESLRSSDSHREQSFTKGFCGESSFLAAIQLQAREILRFVCLVADDRRHARVANYIQH